MPLFRSSRAPLAFSAAFLLAACGGGGGGGPQQGALPVGVQTPIVKEVTIWDEYVGHFEAVNRVEVRPRVSGYLEVVHFEDGAVVKTGEPLFTIDRRPFEAALDAAEARVEAARTAQRLAAAELQRSKKLLDARAGSQEEYDQRLQAKQAADADLAAATAEARQASLDLEFTEVKSPIEGRVGRDLVNKGNLVSAGESLLTTVVSIDPIYFTFTGSERDYLRYIRLAKEGKRASSRVAPNPVRIKLEDDDDYAIEGTMSFVDNAISTTTGTIEAQAVVANEDGFLTPGMFGRMRLYGRDPFVATLIPDKLVQFDQNQQFVWLVGEENKAERRTIALGRLIDDGMRIVDDGLSEGDRVIASGFGALRPGAPVAPQDGPPPQNGGEPTKTAAN